MIKKIIHIFTLKKIPHLKWSSNDELNLKPKFLTVLYLIIGLFLFGIGETLLVKANIGVSPWFVLHQGISFISGYTIGITTFLVSVIVLIFWVPLKQKPGIGTIMNAIIISIVLDFSFPYLPGPSNIYLQLIQVLFAIILVGIGSGFYLVANLGPGPRDGLMTALQQKTGMSFTLIRTLLELSAVILGFYLGGIVGIGTILYAVGIGFSVSFGLYFVGKFF